MKKKIKDLTLEEFKNNYCNKNNNNCEKCKFYSDDDGCMSVPSVVLVYGDKEVEE